VAPTFLNVLAFLLCGLVGVSLGLLGGGGSILSLPVLVYVAHIDPREAVALSLVLVGATSVTTAFLHRRRDCVDRRVGMLFGLAGLPGAFAGGLLTHLVPPRRLLLCFAMLMLFAGAIMLRRSLREKRIAPVARPRRPALVVLTGTGVGFLTGFLGIGGGFLIVPALTMFAGLAMPVAIGTSLMVIALNCAAGLVGHLGAAAMPVVPAIAFTAAAMAGGIAGERLASRTSPRRLRRAFACAILLVGTYMLMSNLRALFA
jgi:uncharacterized membrane protein YfcA